MTYPSSHAITFKCERETLVGVLHLPPEAYATIGIVIVVGGPQYRAGSHRQFVTSARHFARAGYPVIRFDCRGMGDSDGTFPGFEHIDADISAAISCLQQHAPGISGVMLWGLCDAASACLIYGNRRDERVKGLVLANPWVRTEETVAKTYLRHYYFQRLLQKSFWSRLLTAKFNPLLSLRELLENVNRTIQHEQPQDTLDERNYLARMLSGLRIFSKPMLLLLSDRDLTAKEFADFCARQHEWSQLLERKNVIWKTVSDSDHTFSGKLAQQQADDLCTQWLAQTALLFSDTLA